VDHDERDEIVSHYMTTEHARALAGVAVRA
jgi:hypothetical protein